MPPYDPDPQIIEKSLHELEFILEWAMQRGETVDNPVTVLVGGWAVDAYNPWYGSIDIDLVTNNRTKHSLMKHCFPAASTVYIYHSMSPLFEVNNRGAQPER